ncbi:MAG: helix-turn-helix domain-containing protein [Pseudomonadota bacterium]|nr:helix-turn-helix domain-containing protein [Pseudomonadota bacterium]
MEEAQLPLETVGSRLRRAREHAGLGVAALAAQTRISQRQIEAIEASDFAALPGRTYAVGFSRSLARAVGLDEAEVAAATRAELTQQQGEDQRRPVQTFEPGDPARVPSARLTWLALAGVALAVVLGIVFLPSLFSPAGTLPSILPADQSSAAAVIPAAPTAEGPVVFTALQPGVWVKFTDAAGTQLLQKELAQGESYTVPAGQGEVLLQTARPDQLAITIGGQPVPKLSDVQQTMKDVPVSAAALLARGSAAQTLPAAVPTASNAASAPRRAAAAQPREQRIPTPRIEASPAPSSLPSAAPAAPAPTPAAT